MATKKVVFLTVVLLVLGLSAGLGFGRAVRPAPGAAGLDAPAGANIGAPLAAANLPPQAAGKVDIIQVKSSHNDESLPLRDIAPLPPQAKGREREENENPPLPIIGHTDSADP